MALQPAAAQRVPLADSVVAPRPIQRSWTPAISMEILGSAALLSLGDEGIAGEMRRFHDRSGAGGRRLGRNITDIGGVAPLASGLSLLLVGAVSGNTFTRHLGQDVTEAIVTSGLLTAVLKGAIGRARPRMFPDDADEFAPMRGFSNGLRASFPSGHASSAFAAATVLAHGLSAAHPRQQRWLNTALYGSAALIAASRVYVDAHWASDVLAGAAIGTVSGLKVMRRTHRGL
jgi:membrane-associated phospholipid phosphatase